MKGIVFGEGKLGYKFLPKTATTSILHAIYKLEFGDDFCIKETGMYLHNFMNKNKQGDLSDCEKRFIIIRDPVKRFLSAYKNRVIHHQELSENFISENHPKSYWDIPFFSPGLGQFIDNLDDYLAIRPIFHHCRPMVDFLEEKKLGYFTHVYKIENLCKFEDELTKSTGNEIKFGHTQTGGREYFLRDLTKRQMKKIIKFYKADYELLDGFYSIDDLWKEWRGKEHNPETPRADVTKIKIKKAIKKLVNKV